MDLDIVIAQLRAAPSSLAFFGGRIAGAGAFDKSVDDQAWMALPAAYVVPIGITAGPQTQKNGTGYWQINKETIGVIAILANDADPRNDRRGQGAATCIAQVQQAIFKAILNWRPDSTVDNPPAPNGLGGNAGSLQQNDESRGYVFDGLTILDKSDRARLFMQFDFSLEVLVTEFDGWQPLKTPLTSIVGTITSGEAQFDIQIPVTQS